MNKNQNFYFQKLDNVGTFYASTTTYENPNIYRLSVKLKEQVDVAILNSALLETLIELPSFNVKLKRGFFWYYLESNNLKPIIEEDKYFEYMPIHDCVNNNFMFKVTYFNKRINIAFLHMLADGTGSLEFFKILLINYMKIKHPHSVKQNLIIKTELLSRREMGVDSFLKYAKPESTNKKILKEANEKSYAIKGPIINKDDSYVLIGTISIDELKKITKPVNATITAYLTTLLIYSIYKENYIYHRSDNPITIAVPVNLRNYFPSQSMNNFFSTMIISINFSKKEYSFEEVLKSVTKKISMELKQSVLVEKFRSFVNIQKNIILRFIPLVIKDLLIRGAGMLALENGATSVLSNLGIIKLPEEVSKYIDKFDIIAYNDKSLPIKIGLCSFEDKLSICFYSSMVETDIPKYFFKHLSSLGIKVNISSSRIESSEEDEAK